MIFWTEKKLKKYIEELDGLRYKNKIFIPFFHFKEDINKESNPVCPEKTEYEGSIGKGQQWSGRDDYFWLTQKIVIPDNWESKRIIGYFDFGKTGPGTNSGFESMLYINNNKFQGVDTNHQEVILPDSISGKEIELTFRVWTGLEGGGPPRELTHRFNEAFIGTLDEKVDEFYFITKNISNSLDYINKDDQNYYQLLNLLNKVFLTVDWSSYDLESLYKSIYNAYDTLKLGLEEIGKNSLVNVHCIGHTHIDVAWLWRLKHTKEKASRSFMTVLNLMKHYPEYIFLQTQPQIYEYIKEEFPEIYTQIKDKVKEKKWEADGGMWLEADCNVVSGESLVRQILFGTRFIEEEFNSKCKYLWLPDVFGYSWALPQILKKSGIDYFFTTKISWNQFNRIPQDTFKWKGIDGSEVLTHFMTTPNMGQAEFDAGDLIHYTYNGSIHPKTVSGIWKSYSSKAINNDLLLSYGYGDGGGGVNREMLENMKAIDKIPGMPNVKSSRVDDYLEILDSNIKNTDQYVHTWDGELYLEFHRGTYTTHAQVKKDNRKLELLYRKLEMLNVYYMSQGFTGLQKEINKGLKIILRNQFHDIIPGTSITEVYQDLKEEYTKAYQIAKDIEAKILPKLLVGNKNAFTIFNSSNIVKSTIVEIDGELSGEFYQDDKKLLSQIYNNKTFIRIENMKPLSFVNFSYKDISDKKDVLDNNTIIKDSGIETKLYNISWNMDGHLTSVYDKTLDREVLDGKGNVFEIINDKPLTPDAWEIESYYYCDKYNKNEIVNNLDSVQVIVTGDLFTVVEFQLHYKDTKITQQMIVYNDDKRIDFKTNVDWCERQKMLKVGFDVDVRTTKATYDIQFGNIERSNNWNTSWDLAQFEVVGHQWADLSTRDFGVSLMNDCKYGYDIKDNKMRLSLLRSTIYPDPEADKGMHEFTYSLYPHEGDWYEGKTQEKAFDLNNRLKVYNGESNLAEIVELNNDSIMVSAIKQAEDSDDIIIRLYDFGGCSHKLNIDYKGSGIEETDLMENQYDKTTFDMKPYEIKTYRIKR